MLPYNRRKVRSKMSPLVERYIKEVSRKYSKDFQIKSKKNASGLYALVRPIIKLFNKDIDDKFITVLFGTVWVPENFMNSNEMNVLEVMAHETVHEADRNRLGTLLFTILYLSPQILALGALLALFAIWFTNSWLWALLALLFLAPIPSLGRTYIELRGYRMNVLFMRKVDKVAEESLSPYLEYMAQNFTSGNYYFMMPIKKLVISKLRKDALLGKHNEVYVKTLEWLQKEGKV